VTGVPRRANRAARPGVRRAPPGAIATRSRGPSPILVVHLGLVVLLVLAVVALFGVPSVDGNSVAFLGILPIGETLAILVALAVAGATGRHSPLVTVDAIIAVPLVALLLSGAVLSGQTMIVAFVAALLLVTALAGAILAARVVRPHRIERAVLGLALILVLAFAAAFPIAVLVPTAILVTLFAPPVALARPHLDGPPSRPRPPSPLVARGRAPDAAAILAARRSDPPPDPAARRGASRADDEERRPPPV
jgi:hypothetical protein